MKRGKIREFSSAICDPNPVYRDREYARRMGFSDVLMPVTFPTTFPHHLVSESYILESAMRLRLSMVRLPFVFLQRTINAQGGEVKDNGL